MKISTLKTEEIKPYEKNPRRNDQAVDKVANSIREFGFRQPVVVDENHTRDSSTRPPSQQSCASAP